MRKLEIREYGTVGYGEALALQSELSARRKSGEIPDQLLLLEHPHVLTVGRNGREENLLAARDELQRLGIECFETNRGGDFTYHGPGQIVGYPILDLREWKRDVVAYIRALESVIMQALAQYGIHGGLEPGAAGVWVNHPNGERAKICAMGIHLSRWVTTHGFALNWATDLNYFRYIVPCGLTRPVTSMQDLGVRVERARVHRSIVEEFARVFDLEPAWAAEEAGSRAGR